MTQNLMDGEYCCQKYKRFVLNIFCAENIFMDNKYIFVPYEGRFDLNIFWKEILYFWCKYSFTEGEKKKKNVSSAWYPFQIY